MIRVVSPLRLIGFLLVVGGIVLTSGLLAWGQTTMQKSGDIVVESGESARVVWGKFVEEGYTDHLLPWRYYDWRSQASKKIQAGTYHVEEGEHIAEVLDRLANGDTVPDELSITYPEGFTIEQMAQRSEARNIGTAKDFIAATRPSNYSEQFSFVRDIPPGRTLEGYLFPDTYRVFADDTPAAVITRMLGNFSSKLTEDLRTEASASGRTLDQIVIMASIIEREVISDKDMAKVSGVLWKRFDENIGLDADATVRYAVKNWDEPLTVAELQVDSPYNTRRFRGLPPGPISNPGLRALVAAVRPEATEYYYYLSTPDGETIFSRTNDEHNQNKARYLR